MFVCRSRALSSKSSTFVEYVTTTPRARLPIPAPSPVARASGGGATTILLDFDGDRSVNAMGNGQYRMTPVITILIVE